MKILKAILGNRNQRNVIETLQRLYTNSKIREFVLLLSLEVATKKKIPKTLLVKLAGNWDDFTEFTYLFTFLTGVNSLFI